MPAVSLRAPLVRTRLGGLDDDRLAALVAAGDERAFEALYDRHHRALLGFCHHLLGGRDDAEDALQQTFLRAHRALVGRGAPSEVRPWLYAIARNRCRTMLAARRTAPLPDDAVEPATDALGAGVEQRADLRELLADVRALPEDQRSALVLAELADLSHAEIAAVIDVPTPKVKALVHQARTRLIAERDARETPCEAIREQLATARGGVLRRGPLRRHLRHCAACRAYREAVTEQRAALGLVLPVLPSAGLKQAILGGIGGGGAGGAAAGAGGAAVGGGGAAAGAGFSGGGSLALVAKGTGAKLAIGAALAGGGGGAILAERAADGPSAARPVPVIAGAGPAADEAAGAVPVAGPLSAAPGAMPGARGRSGATPVRSRRNAKRAKAQRAAKRAARGRAARPSNTPRGRAKGKRDGAPASARRRSGARPAARGQWKPKPTRIAAASPGRAKPRGVAAVPAAPAKTAKPIKLKAIPAPPAVPTPAPTPRKPLKPAATGG